MRKQQGWDHKTILALVFLRAGLRSHHQHASISIGPARCGGCYETPARELRATHRKMILSRKRPWEPEEEPAGVNRPRAAQQKPHQSSSGDGFRLSVNKTVRPVRRKCQSGWGPHRWWACNDRIYSQGNWPSVDRVR